ncbi:hypothetical protein ACSQ67_025885 [Phaseolus vulgaris]
MVSELTEVVVGSCSWRRRCRVGGKILKSTRRRRKIKGLVDLEGSKSHPRRSVRISNKYPQSAFSSHSKQGMPAVSLLDGDIDNRNLRLHESELPQERLSCGRLVGK